MEILKNHSEGISRDNLRKLLKVKNETLGHTLSELENSKKIKCSNYLYFNNEN